MREQISFQDVWDEIAAREFGIIGKPEKISNHGGKSRRTITNERRNKNLRKDVAND